MKKPKKNHEIYKGKSRQLGYKLPLGSQTQYQEHAQHRFTELIVDLIEADIPNPKEATPNV